MQGGWCQFRLSHLRLVPWQYASAPADLNPKSLRPERGGGAGVHLQLRLGTAPNLVRTTALESMSFRGKTVCNHFRANAIENAFLTGNKRQKLLRAPSPCASYSNRRSSPLDPPFQRVIFPREGCSALPPAATADRAGVFRSHPCGAFMLPRNARPLRAHERSAIRKRTNFLPSSSTPASSNGLGRGGRTRKGSPHSLR